MWLNVTSREEGERWKKKKEGRTEPGVGDFYIVAQFAFELCLLWCRSCCRSITQGTDEILRRSTLVAY